MPEQLEFLLLDNNSGAPPDCNAHLSENDIVEEMRATWRIPFLRQKVRVTLRNCVIDEMNGFLEIATPLPDYPFDATQPLRLRIDSITFTHKQITSCVTL